MKKLIVTLAFAVGLSGCAYHPVALYGTTATAQASRENLSKWAKGAEGANKQVWEERRVFERNGYVSQEWSIGSRAGSVATPTTPLGGGYYPYQYPGMYGVPRYGYGW